MRRLCIFAHYDRDLLIDDYVVYYISELKKVADDIVFVSTSHVSESELKKISHLVKSATTRENEGYDFKSWRCGFEKIGYDNLNKYDEVIVCNDSCYGPLYSFSEMFDKMSKKKDLDAWSITMGRGYYTYMQSYFLVFRKKAYNLNNFKIFFESATNQKQKYDYIIKYEVGLSRMLKDNGCKIGSYVEIDLLFFIRIVKNWFLIKLNFLFYLFKIPFDILLDRSNKNRIYTYLSNISMKDNHLVMNDKNSGYGEIKLSYKVISFLNPLFSNPSLKDMLYIVKRFRSPLIKTMGIRKEKFLMDTNSIDENIDQWKDFVKKTDYPDPDTIERHLVRVTKK